MILRRVALPEVAGALFLTAMPGRDAPPGEFLRAAEAARIGHVLCLAGAGELAQKSPDYAALLAAGDLPWAWRSHPIEDFGIPGDAAAFAASLGKIATLLHDGEHVVLHCAAGIGRTGTAAICLLRTLGLEAADAESRVAKAGSHPETPEQRRFAAGFRPA